MVRMASWSSEVRLALRCRKERSTGIYSSLTTWPGRKGQAVVVGRIGSWASVEPFTWYCAAGAGISRRAGTRAMMQKKKDKRVTTLSGEESKRTTRKKRLKERLEKQKPKKRE